MRDDMDIIEVEIWLYGPMARYAGEQSQGSYAQLQMSLPAGSTIRNLLDRLELPSKERGITFINGDLASLPGLDADLDVVLKDGDRVGISHPKSMWPYQYRFGAATTPQIQETFQVRGDGGLRHAYTQPDQD
jgi:hypothetical protein